MKEYLKNINKEYLQFKIDSFIEDKFIDIIESAKVGKNKYVIDFEEVKNKDLLPFTEIIKNELKCIFDDCKVYILENEENEENDDKGENKQENKINKSIIIDWS